MSKFEMENDQTQFKILTVRMPATLHQRVHAAARDDFTSEAAWARRVFRQALKRQDEDAA